MRFMARREIDPNFPKDTFSEEFLHFAMEEPATKIATIGLYVVALGLLTEIISLTLNQNDPAAKEAVRNFGFKVIEDGAGLIAVAEGLIPAALATLRMAAVEAGLVYGYDPITRGCYKCLDVKYPSD